MSFWRWWSFSLKSTIFFIIFYHHIFYYSIFIRMKLWGENNNGRTVGGGLSNKNYNTHNSSHKTQSFGKKWRHPGIWQIPAQTSQIMSTKMWTPNHFISALLRRSGWRDWNQATTPTRWRMKTLLMPSLPRSWESMRRPWWSWNPSASKITFTRVGRAALILI